MDDEGDLSPEELNAREICEQLHYAGRFGMLRFYLQFIWSWLLHTIAEFSPLPGLTVLCHRLRGVRIGEHVYIGPGVHIDYLYPHLITIEDYVSIGMRTMIFAHSNPTCSLYLKKRFFPRTSAPVTIKEGSWIPPGCIILQGVTIGENSVVGAGSLVNRDVPPFTIYAGHPAKKLKDLERKP